MKIKLSVLNDRRYAGILTFTGHDGKRHDFLVSAQARQDIRGVKDPAPGTYRLKKIAQTDSTQPGILEAYGHAVIFFEGAGSGGILAIHAGQSGNEEKLVPTEGGVGLSGKDFQILLDEIKVAQSEGVLLEVEQKKARFFSGVLRPKLSPSRPVTRVASTSRASHGSSRSQSSQAFSNDDTLYWYMLYSRDDSQVSEAPSDPPFQPGGGETGGGGATGSYGDESQTQNQTREAAEESAFVPVPEEPLPPHSDVIMTPVPGMLPFMGTPTSELPLIAEVFTDPQGSGNAGGDGVPSAGEAPSADTPPTETSVGDAPVSEESPQEADATDTTDLDHTSPGSSEAPESDAPESADSSTSY